MNRTYITFYRRIGALLCSPTFTREATSTKKKAIDVGGPLVFPNSKHHVDDYSCVRIIWQFVSYLATSPTKLGHAVRGRAGAVAGRPDLGSRAPPRARRHV